MGMIYVVTKGNYSDYRIIAATTDQKAADQLAAEYSDRFDDAVVEGYEDAAPMAERLRSDPLRDWTVWMGRDGETRATSRDPGPPSGKGHAIIYKSCRRNRPDGELELQVSVSARSEDHAVKIANEARTYMIANNGWVRGARLKGGVIEGIEGGE